MRNREFVFTPKIEYKLVAERSEANQNSLTFPFWCSFLEKFERISNKIVKVLARSATAGLATVARRLYTEPVECAHLS